MRGFSAWRILSVAFIFAFYLNSNPVLAKRCAGNLASYAGSVVPRDDENMRGFLNSILREYRKGFRGGSKADGTLESGVNENLKHVRRMVHKIRKYAEEIKKLDLDPAILEVGIFLSDVAKNPAVIERYKSMYGGSAFKVFMDHARVGLIEGLKLKKGFPLDDATWKNIEEVIIGHDGPSLEGTWWDENYTKEIGVKYPEITPGSKYAYIHALLDRMDQGGVQRDQHGVFQGGVRKISFDELRVKTNGTYTNPLLETIKYSLSRIHPNSRRQVEVLLNSQKNYFPEGVPNFLMEDIGAFYDTDKLADRVSYKDNKIIFTNRYGNKVELTQEADGKYKASDNPATMDSVTALRYFWDHF